MGTPQTKVVGSGDDVQRVWQQTSKEKSKATVGTAASAYVRRSSQNLEEQRMRQRWNERIVVRKKVIRARSYEEKKPNDCEWRRPSVREMERDREWAMRRMKEGRKRGCGGAGSRRTRLYTGNPPLLAGVPIDRTAFARPCSPPSLPPYLTHSLFLRPSSPTLSSRESVILSPIHTPVRPSPSIFLCLACIHRYKPERNACLLQPVWLRATLVLPRSCSAKIFVENSWK